MTVQELRDLLSKFGADETVQMLWNSGPVDIDKVSRRDLGTIYRNKKYKGLFIILVE